MMKIAENKQQQIKLLKPFSNQRPNLFKLVSKQLQQNQLNSKPLAQTLHLEHKTTLRKMEEHRLTGRGDPNKTKEKKIMDELWLDMQRQILCCRRMWGSVVMEGRCIRMSHMLMWICDEMKSEDGEFIPLWSVYFIEETN